MTALRESSLFKLAIKYLHDYRKMEAEVCRLKKAYGRKKEEIERASAKGKALNSNSTYVKPKHVYFSDSDISLLDTEATIEIENQFGAEETSEAHISNEQTPQEERPEQRLEEENSIHCFGSEASVSRKDVDQQSGQEVAEVLVTENTDTGQTSQFCQNNEMLEELNYELQELQEQSLKFMKYKAALVSQLAKSILTKQEKTSSKKAQKRLNLLEEEIEELNEHI